MTQTLRRSDSDIKAAVVEELGWTPSVDSTHVGVAVDGGAVTLSGEVGSYPEKLMASKAAQRVHGVTAIAQETTVRSRWDEVDDSDIAREIGEALERAVDVPDSVKAVRVTTQAGGIVTLHGAVRSWADRHEAEQACWAAPGVTQVVNDLLIDC